MNGDCNSDFYGHMLLGCLGCYGHNMCFFSRDFACFFAMGLDGELGWDLSGKAPRSSVGWKESPKDTKVTMVLIHLLLGVML